MLSSSFVRCVRRALLLPGQWRCQLRPSLSSCSLLRRGAGGGGALHQSVASFATHRTRLCFGASSAARRAGPLGDAQQAGDPEGEVDVAALETSFWACPLPERLAAVTVAGFMLHGYPAGKTTPSVGVQPLPPYSLQRGAAAATPTLAADTTAPTPVYGAMPMKAFVELLPSAARDSLFASRQDAVQYVRTTAATLLELVYQHGDGGISLSEEVGGEGSVPSSPSSSSFGSLVFVRVRGGERAAAAILQMGARAARQQPTPSPPSSPPSSSNSHDPGAGRPLGGESHPMAATGDDDCCDGERGRRKQESHGEVDSETELTVEQVEALLPVLLAALQKREEKPASRYTSLSEAYLACMREAARHPGDPALDHLAHHLTRDQFYNLFLSSPSAVPDGGTPLPSAASAIRELVDAAVWVLHDKYIAIRKSDVDGDEPPRFTSPQPQIKQASQENNYGGWGAADAVPTKDDVYEILKYVPVNWGNMGNMNIPTAVRKKHLRTSSPLQWFRRQPYYFELRNMNGTTEIRRSCVLHPEAHGLSREDALERLELAIASGEANDLTPLGPDGTPLATEMSAEEKSIHKFFLRVCPPYFAPLSLVMQRYTKKNLNEATLLAMARRRPAEFEIFQTRYADVLLVRKRVGADSRRWRAAFAADLEKHPEDVRGIVMVMNRLCPSWDRPEYVYVRLTPEEQRAIGGFDAMMTILRRHPEIFRVGEHFVCRVDSSDPFAAQEAEPDVHDVTSRTTLREENPYLTPLDVALVFHYAAPVDEPCTATFLVDCASPAIRVALPPRVVTIVQQFPRLFACHETSPGVFSIRKIAPRDCAEKAAASAGEVGEGERSASTAAQTAGEAEEDSSWRELEAEIAEEEHLTKAQLLEAVRGLIPRSGVAGPQLLLWASMQIQRAASHYYGGLLKMVEAEKGHFRVVDSQESKMVYRAGEGTESGPPPRG